MEIIKIVSGRNGRVWPEALRAVSESRRDGRRVILYVPEQITLQTERDLIAGLSLKGLLDIEVISPRKLRLLVREKAGTSTRRVLDEYGQRMAVHRAVTETAEELSYYRNMGDLPGAVERIRAALSELRESEMTPEETEACAAKAETGSMRAKLQDLNRIRFAYETLVEEQFDDEKTAWTDTVHRLGKSGLLQGADLAVYGFDTIRPDLRELLCEAGRLAEHVTVFLTADLQNAPDGAVFREQRKSVLKLQEAAEAAGGKIGIRQITTPRKDCGEMLRWLDEKLFAEQLEPYSGTVGDEITLYAAADREDEAEQIAECLLEWHADGIPWEKMAVALPGQTELRGILLSRLRLNGIPFYTAEKMPAVSHGVCRMLLAAMECISDGYTTESMTEAAMSGFTLLTDEEAVILRNYAAAHGIEGSRWRQPFTRGTGAEAAEAIRQKLTAPMETLREALKAAGNAAESVEAVVRFLEAENVWNRLKEREETLLQEGMYREAVADRQVWKLLTELLDQMWTMLGRRRASLREMKSMLGCALNAAMIAVLPETESGVVLGETGHMQAAGTDALVLPGCEEGILSASETGWLSDREREELFSHSGKEVGVTRERMGWIRRYDYYRTLTAPERKLRISWSLRDGNGSPLQEDGLISRIRAVFPDIRESGGVHGSEEKFQPRTPLKTLESLGKLFAAKQEGRQEPGADSAVIALLHSGIYGNTVRQMISDAGGAKDTSALAPDTAKALFHTETTSISRLERFAACPYQHFIDYGLRPVQQETYDFDAAAAGSFFHAALDRFMKTAGEEPDWPGLPDERVDGIMDAICAELTEEWEGSPLREDALGVWQGEEYLRRVRHAARVLTRFAGNSDFRTIATEKSFGRSSGLPPLTLSLRDGSKVALQGIIDRIDTYENGEGLWLRIVDNKSSWKKPEPAKMEDGEQLQLMIYLKAAMKAYPGSRPAGAMFFPIQDAEVSPAEETPERIEAERLKKVRMKGLANAREDVLLAMDRDIRGYSMDEVFNQDGSISKRADWAVEEETLEGLMAAAEEKAEEICEEIRSGEIHPMPRGSGDADSPCRYCSYRTLCHARAESIVPRTEGTTYRDIAGKTRCVKAKNSV